MELDGDALLSRGRSDEEELIPAMDSSRRIVFDRSKNTLRK